MMRYICLMAVLVLCAIPASAQDAPTATDTECPVPDHLAEAVAPQPVQHVWGGYTAKYVPMVLGESVEKIFAADPDGVVRIKDEFITVVPRLPITNLHPMTEWVEIPAIFETDASGVRVMTSPPRRVERVIPELTHPRTRRVKMQNAETLSTSGRSVTRCYWKVEAEGYYQVLDPDGQPVAELVSLDDFPEWQSRYGKR